MATSIIPFNSFNGLAYTITGGGTVYLNHSDFVILATDRSGMWSEGGSGGRILTEINPSSSITVTRETSNKLKIVSSNANNTRLFAIGYGVMYFSGS